MQGIDDTWKDQPLAVNGRSGVDEIEELDRARSDNHRREISMAAARLLEMASFDAERLVADARAEADSLMAAARAETARVAADLDQYRSTVLRELADRQASTEAKLRTLRQLVSEHRNELRRHFTDQLAQLEDIAPEVPLAAVGD
jgi:cell division septum initiation protein DivIVA